jgi:hypothetical protein
LPYFSEKLRFLEWKMAGIDQRCRFFLLSSQSAIEDG